MLDLEKIKQAKADEIGFFRFKKFDKNQYLITNDAGKFEFLTNEEFEDFIAGNAKKLQKYDDLVKK